MTQCMPKPLNQFSVEAARKIKWILTDVDDTLTLDGRLPPETLQALAALEAKGIKVVAVTGACAGWCDQLVKLWPLYAVIGENGAFSLQSDKTKYVQKFACSFEEMQRNQLVLLQNIKKILKEYPGVNLTTDQPFRFCDVAIDIAQHREPLDSKTSNEILHAIRALTVEDQKVNAVLSSIHINAWVGEYSKRSASEALLLEHVGDVNKEEIVYVGDSPNDESNFEWLENTVGVANIEKFLPIISFPPRYITNKAGGLGFAELAQHILTAQSN